MRALIQRVKSASVTVDDEVVGEIASGLLVFLGVSKGDDEHSVVKLVEKTLNYRVFSDSDGRMNQSLLDIQGEILIVSQFTLSADTNSGLRPSFSSAADPVTAKALYENFVSLCEPAKKVASGIFAADMQVAILNDGPVTFLLES